MERNKTLDCLKGLAILLVVLGHFIENFSGLEIVHNIIYSFHIPLFFAVSGCLVVNSLKKYDTKTFIFKKFMTLFVPFLSWSILAVISSSFSQPLLTSLSHSLLFSKSMWYLWSLFLTMLLFKIDILLKTKIGYFSHLLVWIFIILLPNKYFSFAETEHFYPFFVAGYYFNLSKNKNIKKEIFPFLWIILTVTASIFNLPAIHSSVNFSQPLQLIFAYLWAFCGIIAMYCVFSYLKSKFLTFIGQFTLDIYGAHMFFVRNIVFIPNLLLFTPDIAKIGYSTVYSLVICGAIACVVKFFLNKIPPYRFFFNGQRKSGGQNKIPSKNT